MVVIARLFSQRCPPFAGVGHSHPRPFRLAGEGSLPLRIKTKRG